MTAVEGDARHLRSRARLREAALAAATEKPIAEVTATDLAARASIGRATFYRHTDSPSRLLDEALRAELDALRSEALRDMPNEALERRRRFEATLVKVVEHVIAREAIYGPALLTDSTPGVATMLLGHVRESVMQAQREIGLSFWNSAEALPLDSDPDDFAEAAATGFAYLFVGVLVSWLPREGHRDPHDFLRLFNTLAPPWWLTAGADSTPLDEVDTELN